MTRVSVSNYVVVCSFKARSMKKTNDELNQILGLDGRDQNVIYLATVGMR